MKKEITSVFLTLATVFGFAQQDAIPETVPNLVQLEVTPALPSFEAKMTPKKSFGYLRMGISDSYLPNDGVQHLVPGLGLGYRLAAGASAIDISASFNRRDIRTDEGKESKYVYTLPKANYLYYVTPTSNNSMYAGAGCAWGGVITDKHTDDESEFHGLIPNVAIGYEMNRNAAWRSFVQLDVSQPAIAASQKGAFPRAFAELSLGAGF